MAPNFSKFYDDALKEGLGLVEFIERHHPGEAELKEIKPKTDMPYKGYFPSGKICDIFGKAFKDWSRAFTSKTRGEKNKKMLDFMVARINKTQGLSLTKADLIVSGSGSAPGTNAGGGYSWIHPRLMTHFLQWCCPEFAEEVLDVFQRYLSGDASVAVESAALRAATLESELEAAKNDLLAKEELLDKEHQKLAEVDAVLARERSAVALQLAAVRAEIEDVRKQGADKYEDLQRLHKQTVERDAEALQEREFLLSRDSARPLNIFRTMNPLEVPQSTRHVEPDLWLPARNITTNACIYFSRLNYRSFVCVVSEKSISYKPFAVQNIDHVMRVLKSTKRCARLKVRIATKKMFNALSDRAQEEIANTMFQMHRAQMEAVFAFSPQRASFSLKHALNNVAMYAELCKFLKAVYNVDYSTEIETMYLARMAHNFNEFTCGNCVIPLGPDYEDEFDVLDVELKTL